MTAGQPDVVARVLSGQPAVVTSFAEWRAAARELIVRRIPPEYVQWVGQEGGGDLLSAMPPMAAGELVNDSGSTVVKEVEAAVEADAATEVEADEATEVEADEATEVEADAATEVEADAATEVEADAATEVEVDAATEVEASSKAVTESASEPANESANDSASDASSKLASEETHHPDERSDPPPPNAPPGAQPRISRKLMEMLQAAACYRAHDRWAFLYRVLWRWHHGAHEVISMADEDGARLHYMAKAVRHEEHDMHAYLRFRERPDEAGAPRFVAWFEPAHDVLPQVAQHFARRMGKTSWMIATPEATVLWDGATLHTGAALARNAADFADAGEALWLTYYRSIFNPARLNADIMHGHIRQRFWKNLPEAAVVPHMVTQAAAGARKVGQLDTVGRRGGTTIPIAPEKAVPERQQPSSLDECRRCDLWQNATQAVAGQGARHARIMLVGEQPGDQEDLAGKPFVGPAGELLDKAMDQAGLDRRTVYVTNAVKHFKWEPRGKRRLHKTPAQKEVMACHYWLETELDTVAPQVLVALGSTALKSILQTGSVTMKDYMDAPFEHDGRWVVVTYHPAYALRVPDRESRQAAFAAIVEALKTALRLADGAAPIP